MQISEEENDANVQQKFSASTDSACNKDGKDKYIFCIHIYCIYAFLPS